MNDLALCIINTGSGYDRRVSIARNGCQSDRMACWRQMARHEALHQMHRFGTRFDAEDINAAAFDLESYMTEHVRELESC